MTLVAQTIVPHGGNPPKILHDSSLLSSLPLFPASSRSSCCSIQVYWPEITLVTDPSILIEDSLCAIQVLTNELPPTFHAVWSPRRDIAPTTSTFLHQTSLFRAFKSIPPRFLLRFDSIRFLFFRLSSLLLGFVVERRGGRGSVNSRREEFIVRDNGLEFRSNRIEFE